MNLKLFKKYKNTISILIMIIVILVLLFVLFNVSILESYSSTSPPTGITLTIDSKKIVIIDNEYKDQNYNVIVSRL